MVTELNGHYTLHIAHPLVGEEAEACGLPEVMTEEAYPDLSSSKAHATSQMRFPEDPLSLPLQTKALVLPG